MRTFPLVVAAGAGAVDGILRDADAAAAAQGHTARATNTGAWSTYFEVAAVLGGYLAPSFGFSREVGEPLMHGGLFSLASRGARYAAQQQKLFWGSTTPTAAMPLMEAAAMTAVGRQPARRVAVAGYITGDPNALTQPAGVLV